jgi:hypothetical protein
VWGYPTHTSQNPTRPGGYARPMMKRLFFLALLIGLGFVAARKLRSN